jgi:hypothetical protein
MDYHEADGEKVLFDEIYDEWKARGLVGARWTRQVLKRDLEVLGFLVEALDGGPHAYVLNLSQGEGSKYLKEGDTVFLDRGLNGPKTPCNLQAIEELEMMAFLDSGATAQEFRERFEAKANEPTKSFGNHIPLSSGDEVIHRVRTRQQPTTDNRQSATVSDPEQERLIGA